MADSRLSQLMIQTKFYSLFDGSPELSRREFREVFGTFHPITQSKVQDAKACVAKIQVVWLTQDEGDFLPEPVERSFLVGFVPSPQAGRDFATAIADIENRVLIFLELEPGQPLDPQPTTLLTLELWTPASDAIPLLRLEAQPFSSIFRFCSFPAIRLGFHCNTGGSVQVFNQYRIHWHFQQSVGMYVWASEPVVCCVSRWVNCSYCPCIISHSTYFTYPTHICHAYDIFLV